MTTPPPHGPWPLLQEDSTLQRRIGVAGGQLSLWPDRLVFVPWPFYLGRRHWTADLPLAAIRSIRPAPTRMFGLIPVSDHSFTVETTDRKSCTFYSRDRDRWLWAIHDLRRRMGSPLPLPRH